MERGTKHGNYWDLKLDFPSDEPTTALTAKRPNRGFDNSSHCIKQKMRCDKQPFLNIPLNHLVVDELYLMLRAIDNNEMLTGKLVASTTGQVS